MYNNNKICSKNNLKCHKKTCVRRMLFQLCLFILLNLTMFVVVFFLCVSINSYTLGFTLPV